MKRTHSSFSSARYVATVLGLLVAAIFTFAPAQAKATCKITIGENGQSWTYQETGTQFDLWNTSAASFIRETSTDSSCDYLVCNGPDMGYPCVHIGSGLNTRIRAGLDGIVNKDSGGGDTWRIRFVQIMKAPTIPFCSISVGGNGVRMTYPGYPPPPGTTYFQLQWIPASDKVDWATIACAGGHFIRLYNSSGWTGSSRDFTSFSGTVSLPWRARSMWFY